MIARALTNSLVEAIKKSKPAFVFHCPENTFLWFLYNIQPTKSCLIYLRINETRKQERNTYCYDIYSFNI